jgi:hypothetical protein
MKFAIKTFDNHYVTNANDGGLGAGSNVPIRTDATTVGPNEIFTFAWIDESRQLFSLRTAKGNYVTAAGGGGKGGPNTNDSPIHTDAKKLGGWEVVTFVKQQEAGKLAIMTGKGQYWSAVNGGGWGEPANTYPIHTDSMKLGGWETFTLETIRADEATA